MVLGIGSIINFVELTPIAIFSFSISGIFFILSDVSKHYVDKWDSKKALGESRMIKVKLYHFSNVIFLFLGILFLICGPFLKLNGITSYLEKLGETLALVAIGLTIYKVGLENEKKNIEMISQVADEFEEIIERYEKECKDD